MNIAKSSSLNTEKSVGVVIPTLMRHDFSPFVRQMEKALLKAKILPYFIVAADSASQTPVSKVSSSLKNTKNLEILIKSGGIGQRISQGFSKLAPKTDAVFFICDDFEHLVPSIAKFAKVLACGNDYLSASWNNLSTKYLPYALYANEKMVSCSVTYLNQRHPKENSPTAENFESFAKAAKTQNTWYQAYFGLLGVRSAAWVYLNNCALEIFSKFKPALTGVGFEVAMPIAARSSGLKVSQLALPKRYEHEIMQPGSLEEKKFAASRASQFVQGLDVSIHYAKLCCSQKAGPLVELQQQGKALIEQSGFTWPGGVAVMPSKWNTQIRTTF